MTTYTPAPGYKWNAVLVILRHQDQILLLQRKKEPNYGLYVPPGGKIEPHERPRDAAARECEEETGVRPNELHFLGIMSETSPTEYNWTTFVYWAESEFFEPPTLDEGELGWVPLAKAGELPGPVTAPHIYQALQEGKQLVLEVAYDAERNALRLRNEITGEQFIGEV